MSNRDSASHPLMVTFSTGNDENQCISLAFNWGPVHLLVTTKTPGLAQQSIQYLKALWQKATWKPFAAEAFFSASFDKAKTALAALSEPELQEQSELNFFVACLRNDSLFIAHTGPFLVQTQTVSGFERLPSHARKLAFFNDVPLTQSASILVSDIAGARLFETFDIQSIWQGSSSTKILETLNNLAEQSNLATAFMHIQIKKPRQQSLSPKPEKAIAPSAQKDYRFLVATCLAALFTIFHITSYWHPVPRHRDLAEQTATLDQPKQTSKDLDSQLQQAKEVEQYEGFNWNRQPCPMSHSEMLKSIAGNLRDSFVNANQGDHSSKELGDLALEEYRRATGVSFDLNTAEVDYVQTLTRSVARVLELNEGSYNVYISEHSGVNAFALPGGNVILERGLLNQFIANEAQLVFVLAHELSHVSLKHTSEFFRIMNHQENTASGFHVLLSMGYATAFGMEQEQEADQEALKVLLKLKYSPYQAAQLLAALNQHQESETTAANPAPTEIPEELPMILREVQDAVSTHPNLDRRICEWKNKVVDHKAQLYQAPHYVGASNYRMKKTREQVAF